MTQNIKSLAARGVTESLVHTPQGRVQGHFRCLRLDDGMWIVSDPLPATEDEQELIHALLQFRVADDVHCESLSEALCVVRVIAPNGDPTSYGAAGIARPNAGSVALGVVGGTEAVAVESLWGTAAVTDFILPPRGAERLGSALAPGRVIGEQAAAEAEWLRIVARAPVMGRELSEHVLAPEIDLSLCVSFNKGCYAGQEVVEMATARGRPNRRLVLLRGTGNELLATGTALTVTGPETDDTERRPVGTITSSAVKPGTNELAALAFVRASCSEGAELSAGGVTVGICPV